jgi:hypothetical protein
MSAVVVFAIGVLVFLITVYGTVVFGGLLLTARQLDDQPDLAPEVVADLDDADGVADRTRRVASADF